MIEQRFFGHPESPLFGVYHQPRGSKVRASNRAAIICPPIGQEYNRTHWTHRLFANQIARNGIHVLRMDYHGIGDSAQSVDEISGLQQWRRNIEQAIDHLKNETSAETIMLVGHRFGATLAAQVAKVRPDVNAIVAWEPILDGKAYLDALRKMHATMLDLWVCKMSTPKNEFHEEILGSRYLGSLIDEIEATKLDLGNVIQPQLIADLAAHKDRYSHPEPGNQFVIEDPRASTWYELNELELAYLRPEAMRQIVKKVSEMFDRLERFKALTVLEPAMEAVQ